MVSERQDRRDLKESMEAGHLNREGKGRATVFVRLDKAVNPAKPGQGSKAKKRSRTTRKDMQHSGLCGISQSARSPAIRPNPAIRRGEGGVTHADRREPSASAQPTFAKRAPGPADREGLLQMNGMKVSVRELEVARPIGRGPSKGHQTGERGTRPSGNEQHGAGPHGRRCASPSAGDRADGETLTMCAYVCARGP